MLSKAEIKRRKQQSARDKARYWEEQEKLERRRQNSLRDKARHRVEQARLYWTSPSPEELKESPDSVSVTMAPQSVVKVLEILRFSSQYDCS